MFFQSSATCQSKMWFCKDHFHSPTSIPHNLFLWIQYLSLSILAVMIHWTDQIRKLLNAQDTIKMSDTCGPLQEIDLWRSRSTKLLDISQQLQKPGVKHIQNILKLSKSPYVHHFSELTNEIQVRPICWFIMYSRVLCPSRLLGIFFTLALFVQNCSLEAQSNLSFLSILNEPCEELAQLKPSQVAPKLQHIIYLIRVIWVNSEYYNTNERITGLFHKVHTQSMYSLRKCL